MKDQEKCRAIAEWLGWEFSHYEQIWIKPNGLKTDKLPSWLDTNAAFDLLDELVKRGYMYRLYYTPKHKHDFTIWPCDANGMAYDSCTVEDCESKSAAIVAGILALIEKEKEK